MEFLRAQIAQIRQQLSGLTASQRMLAGALIVIMVMTLFWWGSYAGKAEMEPVLDVALGTEEIATIKMQLAAKSIPATVVGDRVMVPADRKMEAIAMLGYAQVLPHDTKNAFDDLIAKSSPFSSPRREDAVFLQIKQQTLAQLIRQWPQVAHAAVLIDDKRQRGPGGVEPSATVNITMKSGQAPGEQLVNAAADFIAGAVADLKRDRVRVIIDGISHRVRSQDDMTNGANGAEWLGYLQQSERYYMDKVRAQFGFIDGLMVAVNVKPNLARKESVDHKVYPKDVVSKPASEQTSSEDNRSSQRAGGENGMAANVPLTANDGAAGDSTSGTTETSKIDYFLDHAHTDTKTWESGGDAPVATVSVLVPRSYMLKEFKARSKTSDDPKEEALVSFMEAELARMKPWVIKGLGLPSDDAVSMDWYPDLMPTSGMAPQAASTSMPLAITDHFKEIGIGALALLSLFMVSNMVKKGTPAPAIAAVEPVRPPAPLPGPEEAVGEAMEGTPALDGVELDEDSARAQQILTQVSDLVGTNPDGAAALVKRWLNRT